MRQGWELTGQTPPGCEELRAPLKVTSEEGPTAFGHAQNRIDRKSDKEGRIINGYICKLSKGKKDSCSFQWGGGTFVEKDHCKHNIRPAVNGTDRPVINHTEQMSPCTPGSSPAQGTPCPDGRRSKAPTAVTDDRAWDTSAPHMPPSSWAGQARFSR